MVATAVEKIMGLVLFQDKLHPFLLKFRLLIRALNRKSVSLMQL